MQITPEISPPMPLGLFGECDAQTSRVRINRFLHLKPFLHRPFFPLGWFLVLDAGLVASQRSRLTELSSGGRGVKSMSNIAQVHCGCACSTSRQVEAG